MENLGRQGYKVVVTDHNYADLNLETAILAPLGCTVRAAQCRTEQDVAEVVADADYIITQFAPLTAQVIHLMPHVRLIVRYGVGVDNVDLAAAAAQGIPVCNVPDYCTDEVADHAMGMILALTRQITRGCLAVRAGHWTSPPPTASSLSLKDMMVGVVGCGRIGRAVIERLQPYKTRILVTDPFADEETVTALGCVNVSLDRLLASSDLITLHCPSTDKTWKMIDVDAFSRMKDGALLVNVARGTLVDTPALVAALRGGKLGGAALDVSDPEPINADSPLLTMDNVVITPHIAANSERALTKLRTAVANTVVRSIRGESPLHCVNGATSPYTSCPPPFARPNGQ